MSTKKPAMMARYNASDRMNHWAQAILFFAAGLSGLAFFHPSLFFLSTLFGGGPWTRILHPFFGVLMALVFLLFFFRHVGDNRAIAADAEWRKNGLRMIMGDNRNTPPAGKFNAGQKGMFWAISLCVLVLLLTGLVFWRPWFAPYFPIGAIRVATLLHAAAAAMMVIVIIGHIYMAIWTKGSIHGMVRGEVSEAWARQNHVLWYREMKGGK